MSVVLLHDGRVDRFIPVEFTLEIHLSLIILLLLISDLDFVWGEFTLLELGVVETQDRHNRRQVPNQIKNILQQPDCKLLIAILIIQHVFKGLREQHNIKEAPNDIGAHNEAEHHIELSLGAAYKKIAQSNLSQ